MCFSKPYQTQICLIKLAGTLWCVGVNMNHTPWDTFGKKKVLRGLEQLKDLLDFKWKKSHCVSILFIYLLNSSVKTYFFCFHFLLLRCFMVPILTSSGSRGTSACMWLTCLTHIRQVELLTWPDIPSTICLSTSAAWTQINVTSWLTGGSGMLVTLCVYFISHLLIVLGYF